MTFSVNLCLHRKFGLRLQRVTWDVPSNGCRQDHLVSSHSHNFSPESSHFRVPWVKFIFSPLSLFFGCRTPPLGTRAFEKLVYYPFTNGSMGVIITGSLWGLTWWHVIELILSSIWLFILLLMYDWLSLRIDTLSSLHILHSPPWSGYILFIDSKAWCFWCWRRYRTYAVGYVQYCYH